MMTQHLNLSLELKQISKGEFEGHGSVFGNIDLGGDVVVPGAFKKSLAEHAKAGTLPQMFWMHKADQVPGLWHEMREDEKGLYVRGELLDTALGKDMRTLLDRKAVRGLSIGYRTRLADYDKDGNRLLKELEVWEVSLVSLAMNPLARVESMKTAQLSNNGEFIPTKREFEQALIDIGIGKNVARQIIGKVYDDQTGGTPDPARWDAGDVDEQAKQLVEELRKTEEWITASNIQAILDRK